MTSSAISDTRAALKDIMQLNKDSGPTKTEIEEYLNDALDEASLEDEFDILSWWKLKAPKYPIISKLTRDILAIPVSTIASEATFSTSGRTLSPIRNSLNDESIEALVCCQDWLSAAVTENGLELGDPLWPGDEVALEDDVCASGDSAVCQ